MAGKLRITGGQLRGRLIDVPEAADRGELRPTPDRVRAAIFSSLSSLVLDANVLDVFAGSGVQALEAISRGAKSATFIEKNPKSASVIKSNARKLTVESQCQVIVGDAFKEIEKLPSSHFDVVFVDPPYTVLVQASFWPVLSQLLSSNGVVIFRREKLSDFELPVGFEMVRDKKYGGTAVFFLRRTK